MQPRHVRLPFIDSVDKAHQAVRQINHTAEAGGQKAHRLHHAGQHGGAASHHRATLPGHAAGHVRHLRGAAGNRAGRQEQPPRGPLLRCQPRARNTTTASKPSTSAWRTTMARATATWQGADVILVGVSRSGKTPTSLYLAMQYGLKAANYPLIPEDFERRQLPPAAGAAPQEDLRPDHRARTAQRDPQRAPAQQPYASLENCRMEVSEAEAMMRRSRHPLAVHHHQVDRGDRHHHPAGHPARAADLLTPHVPTAPA
jgi:hypothetical protein